MAEGIYAYGVTRAAALAGSEPPGPGLDDAPVAVMRAGAFAALVSRAPAAGGPVQPTRARVLAHDAVVAGAARDATVLPVAFGTVLRSEADLRALLAAASDTIGAALTALDGRVEVTMHVTWTADGAHDVGRAVDAVRRALADGAHGVEAVHELPAIGAREAWRAAVLLPRDAVPDAVAAVAASLTTNAADARLRWSGPGAPFHFARVRLGVEPGAGARRA